jgi:hypothetical protein
VLGVVIFLGSNTRFWKKAKAKQGSVERGFLPLGGAREGALDYEQLRKMSAQQAKEMLHRFPLLIWLYDNYRDSSRGPFVTLIGVVLGFLGILTGAE